MVTVIGAGIAGTLLAGALARDGHPVTVYERRPTADNGAFVVLDDRAHAALRRLGVPSAELLAASTPLRGRRLVRHGIVHELVTTGHRLYFRRDLMRVLTGFAASTPARFHHGTPITGLDPDTGALYSGTATVAADSLIIAADGIASVARAALEPDRPARYAGQMIVFGVPDRPVRPGTAKSVLHFIHGPLGTKGEPTGMFGHFWDDRTAIWFAMITGAPLSPPETGRRPVDQLAGTISAAFPAIADLVAELLDATDSVYASNARVVPLAGARPPQSPLILCGDADHAITPAAGLGASLAIQDVEALHPAIANGLDPAAVMADRRGQIVSELKQALTVLASAHQPEPSPG